MTTLRSNDTSPRLAHNVPKVDISPLGRNSPMLAMNKDVKKIEQVSFGELA